MYESFEFIYLHKWKQPRWVAIELWTILFRLKLKTPHSFFFLGRFWLRLKDGKLRRRSRHRTTSTTSYPKTWTVRSRLHGPRSHCRWTARRWSHHCRQWIVRRNWSCLRRRFCRGRYHWWRTNRFRLFCWVFTGKHPNFVLLVVIRFHSFAHIGSGGIGI
jgi:hypothetical protein